MIHDSYVSTDFIHTRDREFFCNLLQKGTVPFCTEKNYLNSLFHFT